MFVWYTWKYRLWPTIRVEVPESERPDPEDFTPMHPDCLTAPEMKEKWDQTSNFFTRKWHQTLALRRDRPEKFCLLASIGFTTLAYFGCYLSLTNIYYYGLMTAMILPGAIRLLLKHPAVHCYVETVLKTPEKKSKSKSDVTDSVATKDKDYYSNMMETITNKGQEFVTENLPEFVRGMGNDCFTKKEDKNEEEERLIVSEVHSGVDDQASMQLTAKLEEEDQKSEDDDSMLHSMESAPFVSGLDPIPSPEELDEEEKQDDNKDLVKTTEDPKLDLDEDEKFLPTSESIPSVDEDGHPGEGTSEGEPDSESKISLLNLITNHYYNSTFVSVFDLPGSKSQVKESSPLSSSSEVDELPVASIQESQTVMLMSALKEEGQGQTVQRKSSSGSEEDFELITEEELKAVDVNE